MMVSAMQLKAFVPSRLRPAARRTYEYMQVQYDRYVYERPNASYRRRIAERATMTGFLDYAERLCADGCVVIPNYFNKDDVARMREEFERLVRSNPLNPESAKKNSVHIPNSRLHETVLFGKLAFEPNLLALAQYYWGKPVVLNGAGGQRNGPFLLEDQGSNQWHHDGKRKMIRIFIFLTDVPEDGQCTRFVPGTHRIFYRDITQSRLAPEAVLKFGTPVACTGPAGSVTVFDSNTAHRGTRNLGPRRDTWDYSYRAPNPKSTKLSPVRILHPDVVKSLTEEQRWIARIA